MSVADSITSALTRFGRPMILRRKVWDGNQHSSVDVSIFGVSEGYLSLELTDGSSIAGTAKVTFSNAQIAAASWPGPPQKLDEIIIDDGQVRTIEAVETKYLGSEVLVFVAEVQALSFDREIRIERYTATDTEMGGETQEWAELATVIASKVDISGSEDPAAGSIQAAVVTRFRVRWAPVLADLSPLDRVVYEGRVYDIKAVKEQQLKVGIEILATASAD